MFDLSLDPSTSIASVRLNRPPANAIGLKEIEQLDAVLDNVAASSAMRALVFHSHSRFFSAGADIALMGRVASAPDGPEQLRDLGVRMQATFRKLELLPIPTLCAISGICVGGGLELALACDLRVAERNATLGLPESRIGLLPGAGGTQRLTALAGLPVAKRLILTGELISGEEAYRLGVVQDLVAPGSAWEHANALARTIIAAPQRTIEAIKRCLALAPSETGYEAEIEETLALHREPETKALIAEFLRRASQKRKVAV
jgi:enoyl-CoA hydratase/carnithine racemase